MSTESPEVTVLLRRWRDGDRAAEAQLFEIVLPELRRIARKYMLRERRHHTLQATELIGKVYPSLARAKNTDWQGRSHFFAIAATTMRRYLIDYARARQPGTKVELDERQNLPPVKSNMDEVLLIDGLVETLANERPEWCSVVVLKYFVGLTNEETARALNISTRTVQRNWNDARQWLYKRLHGDTFPDS